MSEVWKCTFFVALCWTLMLNTRSYEITQCPSTYLDTALCSFDKVANITRVYVGGRPDDWDCVRKSGDCFLEINSTNRNWIYNQIINNCNGTSACRGAIHLLDSLTYQCYGQWISSKYQVIEYDCIHPKPGRVIKYTTQCNQQYASSPRCPVGRRIVIDEVYGGVNRTSVSSSESSRTTSQDCVSVVQPGVKQEIKDKCEGRIACDQLSVNYWYIHCSETTNYWTLMDYAIIQYHCAEYGVDELSRVTCASSLQNTEKTAIRCPGNGINIWITDVWLGFGDDHSCNEFDLMTTKCLRTPSDSLWRVQSNCDGKQICELDFMKYTYCNGQTFTSNDYMLTLYECRSELHQDRFCNNETISTKCSDDNLIYISNVLYGYLYSDDRCVEQLRQLSWYNLCERDAAVDGDAFYNEIISSCHGKTKCDEGLVAQQGPPITTCPAYYWVTPDYIAIEYYCYPGHLDQSTEVMTATKPSAETTDVLQPTTGMLVTGDDKDIHSNETSNGQMKENEARNINRIIFIVIPIVVVIGLVMAITTGVLLYKKRKQTKGTDGRRTLDVGQGEVNASEPVRSAFHCMKKKAPSKPPCDEVSEASPYSNIDDGNRVPVYENNDFVCEVRSNEDNKASNVTEVYAEVDKTKKIKCKANLEAVDELNTTELYAEVDKKKKKMMMMKSKDKVEEVEVDEKKTSKAKPETDCESNLYANVDNGGADDSDVQAYTEEKPKCHSSLDETVIVDNELYCKKNCL